MKYTISEYLEAITVMRENLDDLILDGNKSVMKWK